MRILILSFYFTPDLSACSFRNAALVDELKPLLAPGDSIDILTTLPHRYHDFAADAPEHEQQGAVSIRRIPLPTHRSGMVDQSKSFAHYALSVRSAVKRRHYDLVYASSSRLMTAVLGSYVARRLRAPLYLDIRDIFVDTIRDLLPGLKGSLLMPVVKPLEAYAMRRAQHINLVSPGFLPYFKERYPRPEYSLYFNGIDDDFLGQSYATALTGPKILLYAGNIGEGQGLHHIVAPLATLLGSAWRIKIIGSGGTLNKLKQSIANAGAANVELLPPVTRAELINYYREASCLFLHLNAHQAFLKVLPSKLFEYAATGKPILAGVAGCTADMLNDEVENATVFSPCDAAAGAGAMAKLKLAQTDRQPFVDKYNRHRIMKDMARDVLSVGRR